MAWSRPAKGRANQIGTLQMYRRAAGLADADYRDLLYEVTGCRSSTDPSLTQHHFDQVMARVEAVLDYRIKEGLVERPTARKFKDLHYWRIRLPKNGAMNSRQRQKIFNIWAQLSPRLPESARCLTYLTGIAEHACGYRVRDFWELKAWQANLLIEALKDRLRYALRGSP